jgi:hypothetical protein
MRHGDGHYALSYNVQISTDAAYGIAVGLDVGQTAPDYEYLAPAVDQIEERLGQTPDQMVVDAGYISRESILMAHERMSNCLVHGLRPMAGSSSGLRGWA